MNRPTLFFLSLLLFCVPAGLFVFAPRPPALEEDRAGRDVSALESGGKEQISEGTGAMSGNVTTSADLSPASVPGAKGSIASGSEDASARVGSRAEIAFAGAPSPLPLPSNFLDSIVDESGQTVSFALPGGQMASGTVGLIERDHDGVLLVQGRLTSPQPGFYFFNRETLPGVLGAFFGNIRFDEGTLAYRVEPIEPGGASALVARHIDQVICVGFPSSTEVAAHTAPGARFDEPVNAPQTHPGDIPIPDYQEIIPLESLPGASAVLFLDFEGGEGPWVGWGDFDVVAPGTSNAQVKEIWERVSEDFQPFNINVTTDRKVFLAAPRNSRQRVMITPTNTASPGNGGVAQFWAFNSTADAVCWAFYSVGKNSAEVISHEIGHTLGLSHDGRDTPDADREEYFGGYGEGATGWAPIMGVGYYENLTQWSKGEYAYATNTEDDLAIITNNNNAVDYRADDIGDDLDAATYLEIFDDFTVSNEGIIEEEGDYDAFRFATAGGEVSLRVRPVNNGPNLDIEAEILDASGTVLERTNAYNALDAVVEQTLVAGEYWLRVTATGRPDREGEDYSTYATLGAYLISGNVENGIQPDRFSVPENSAANTVVGVVTTRNAPTRAQLTYTIESGNEDGAFALDASDGTLTVADTAQLDFERLSTRWDDPATIELFVAIANSSDPELNERIRVVVSIADLNEDPTLSDASVQFFSNTAIGTELLTLDGADQDRFDFVDYAIVSGNPRGTPFAIDSSGTLSVSGSLEVDVETVYPLVIAVTDQGDPALTAEATVSVTVFPLGGDYTPGSIVRTFYESIGGTAVNDLTGHPSFPDQPNAEESLSSFEGGDHGDNYGSAFRGYLLVPVTGSYRFWVASDDGGDFLLSSSSDPAGAVSRASVPGHTDPRDYEKYSEQQSALIPLQAGQVYYVEARHKEGGGGDHLSVAWEGPGISRQVIPGKYLAPYQRNYAPTIVSETFMIRPDIYDGARFGTVTVADVNTTDTHHSFDITGGAGRNVFVVDPDTGVLAIGDGIAFSTGNSFPLDLEVEDSGIPAAVGSGRITVRVGETYGVEVDGVVQQIWDNVHGGSLADLESDSRYPDFPTRTRVLSSFDTGEGGLGSNYGSRIRAYVVPPTSGDYRFYIASDDHSELRFSATGDPADAVMIASVDGWVDPPSWTAQPDQESQVFTLVGRRGYYIEALHRQGIGGDYLRVGWTGPGIEEVEVIPGEHLRAFDINVAPVWEDAPYTMTIGSEMPDGTTIGQVQARDPEESWLTYAILDGNAGGIFEIDPVTGDLFLDDGGALAWGDSVELQVGVQDDGIGGIYPYKSTTSTVTIMVAGIESWRVGKFGSDASNPLIAGDQADPDSDGFANLIEYALGLDPLAADGDGALAVTTETVGSERYLEVTVARNPLATDVDFAFEVAGDLAPDPLWSESSAAIQVISPTMLRLRDTVPVSATDARFIRLRITH